MFDKELEFYSKNKKAFLKEYLNKYLIIKDNKLLGSYDTQEEAYKAGLDKYNTEPFLIKKVEKEEPNVNIPALYFGVKNARI